MPKQGRELRWPTVTARWSARAGLAVALVWSVVIWARVVDAETGGDVWLGSALLFLVPLAMIGCLPSALARVSAGRGLLAVLVAVPLAATGMWPGVLVLVAASVTAVTSVVATGHGRRRSAAGQLASG